MELEMNGGSIMGVAYTIWRMYIAWGLVVQSLIAFIILSINTIVMGYNKDKTVQSHWIANIFSIVFYVLAISCALILWFFPAQIKK
jgi:hypothetical protein